jgi:two-component system response regulator (stage 0 sporulation protein F)/two-component system response regulator MtrA
MRVPQDVIVVDDDQDILEVVAEALRDEGFRVAAFADGESALAYAHDHEPALVLTDLLIPPGGGKQLVEGLRALHGRRLPIVVMTAFPDISRLSDVSVEAVLAKPFELDDLSSTVRRWATPAA